MARAMNNKVKHVSRRIKNAYATWERARSARAAGAKGPLAQIGELVRLKRATGLTAAEYFNYALYRRELGFQAKCEYLTRSLHERYLAPLNLPEYGCLLRNKAVFARYFGAHGLPMPRILGVFHPQRGESSDGKPLHTYDHVRTVLNGFSGRGVVCKPVQGGSGRCVQVFERVDDDGDVTLLHVDGTRLPLRDLTAQLIDLSTTMPLGFLLQERVTQHARLARFNPATLHTVRIVTLLLDTGEVHIIGAALKIGLDRSGVESLIDTNLCAPVDWRTGRLGKAAFRIGDRWEYLHEHPHSRERIDGVMLPSWREVQAMAVKAARTACPLRSIGWDIGFAEEGPVLIEGNEIWGEEILQVALGHGIWTAELRYLVGAAS